MTADLLGRGAIVTGGNSGIGLAMARGLAEAGAHVALWGSNAERNAAAERLLRADGMKVFAVDCDVSKEAHVAAAFSETMELLPNLHVCVANAGIDSPPTRFCDMSLEDWRRVLAVNLDGAFLTMRASARHLVKQGKGGSLIAVSSLAARLGKARGQHYAASKAGLIAMMNGLAVELGPHRIRANSVLPGWIETPLFEPYKKNAAFIEHVQPRVPVGRWGLPDDLAGIAVYLASDVSSYHTGDTIVIDGGYSLF